jgi:NTP pyrophosphatase (non-canonical NTP hydrolase)
MHKEHSRPDDLGYCLDHLAEECAEVILAVSKIKRFGVLSYNPTDPNKVTNYQRLKEEMDDVNQVFSFIRANIKRLQLVDENDL